MRAIIRSINELKDKISGLSEKRRVGVVMANDSHTLDAVLLATREGLIEPILLGVEAEIRALLAEFGCGDLAIEIHDFSDPEACAKQAAQMVRDGELDCIMKGKLETNILMKVMVDRELGIRTGTTMSSVGFYESPYYHKVFAITDCGLLTYPTLEQKRDMINTAVAAMQALGVSTPKVAVLAAVEHVNPKMKESVEADALKKMWESGEISGCVVEGPISYDLAMVKEAAETKGYKSPVAGDADILMVPDICSGNLLYKSLMCTGGAKSAGTIIGAMVPLVFTSRSATTEDKYLSILLNALIGKSGRSA